MKEVFFKDINIFDVGNIIHQAGALYSDGRKFYLVPFPEVDIENIDDQVLLDMNTEQWDKFLRQTDYLEVRIAFPGAEKAIFRKSQRQIKTQVSWNVFKRDHYECRYCGRDDVPLTCDHVILWENGGPDIEDNLISSCKRCNKLRGNMEYQEWMNSDEYKAVSKNLSLINSKTNLDVAFTLGDLSKLTVDPTKRSKRR